MRLRIEDESFTDRDSVIRCLEFNFGELLKSENQLQMNFVGIDDFALGEGLGEVWELKKNSDLDFTVFRPRFVLDNWTCFPLSSGKYKCGVEIPHSDDLYVETVEIQNPRENFKQPVTYPLRMKTSKCDVEVREISAPSDVDLLGHSFALYPRNVIVENLSLKLSDDPGKASEQVSGCAKEAIRDMARIKKSLIKTGVVTKTDRVLK